MTEESRTRALGGVLYAQSSWRPNPGAMAEAVDALLSVFDRPASALIVDPSEGSAPCVGPYSTDALLGALELEDTAGVGIEGAGLWLGLEPGDDDEGGPPHLYFAVGQDISEAALLEGLRRATERLPILHGGVDVFDDIGAALGDMSLAPGQLHLVGPEDRLRWRHDSARRRQLWRKVRRLFPLTILGAPLCGPDDERTALSAGAVDAWRCNAHLFLRATPSVSGLLDSNWRVAAAGLARWLWPRTLRGPSDAPVVLGPPAERTPSGTARGPGPRQAL